MKKLQNTIIEKLNKLENFVLRSGPEGPVLWNLSAPGLHIMLIAYQYMKFTGERGKAALLNHSSSGDFFTKTYDILTKAGLTKDYVPEVWGYMRELNKYATTAKDPETKANTNLQLFRFIQEFMEGILFTEYLTRAGKEITDYPDIIRKLIVAADSFVVRSSDGGVQVFGGYPWFDQGWARDTFISLNGLLLLTGRYEHARSVFSYYARLQNKDGLLPNRIFPDGKKEFNTADGSLWFIEALKKYQRAVPGKDGESFIKKMILTVNRIIECYTKESGDIYLDRDNLVVVPAQWTWMDAAPGGVPVTPRNGKPVEIQALFYNALAIASEFNMILGNRKLASRYTDLKNEVGKSINARFFEFGRLYPFDVVDGDPHGGAIRPNAVFLLSLSSVGDLVPRERKESVLDVIEHELLTPYGLRTLSPFDARYIGTYDTFAALGDKDRAYHQGTVWPYLISHYITAKLRCMEGQGRDALRNFIRNTISSLTYTIKDKDTVPELFTGSEPFTAGGAVSQGWSVSALIEVLDLLNTLPALPDDRPKK